MSKDTGQHKDIHEKAVVLAKLKAQGNEVTQVFHCDEGKVSEANIDKINEIVEAHGILAALPVASGEFYNTLSVGHEYENHNEEAKRLAKKWINSTDGELKNSVQRGVNQMMSNFVKGTQNG